MPRYSAAQIYGFARRAGFTPDEAATMTAIALAESGGNSGAHNPVGEDSRGLWQINARAHPDLARKYNLYDPAQNALAAHAVSRGGLDASPWTVTHGGSNARYLRYRQQAEAAAAAYGDGAVHGAWTGTPGYGHPLNAAGSPGDSPAGPPGDSPALARFLEVARNQVGDQYIFGAEAKLGDPNPTVFDCSELTQWAAHQAGVKIPDGATAQYLHLKQRGMLVPVEEGVKIPGALLFSFDREPRPGDGRTPGAHVAISLGNGKTVEARNRNADVGEFAVGKRFQYAALIPGISDGTGATPPPMPTAMPTAAPATAAVPLLFGGSDTDRDGLTDDVEQRLGLDPTRMDTDGDNLSDSYELVTARTDPTRADTDGDRLTDAFELAAGLDPTSPDSDRDGHLDGSFARTWIDTDKDRLDDDVERLIGLDPLRADTDGDGVLDALAVQAPAIPLGPPPPAMEPPVGGLPQDDLDPLGNS
ncbi:MAG TPA: transglycosylase SLT domain-containing protein [Pilimelia sp.]|nr:transglycosylase SLT domain-containing protein [Pilimelia sp.]